MQITVLKTDFGPHPASKWAEVTVDHVVKVDPNASEAELQAGNKLRHDLIEVLEKHHGVVQEHERGKLGEDMLRLHENLDPLDEHVEDAMDEINRVAEKSDYAYHFKQPAVQAYVRQVLKEHFATSMDVERSWHADRNADHPVVKEYREVRDAIGAHNVGKIIAARRANEASGN